MTATAGYRYRYRYRPMSARPQYLWRVEVTAIVGDGEFDRRASDGFDDDGWVGHVEVGQTRSYQTAAAAEYRAKTWRNGGHTVTVVRSAAICWPAA